MSPQASTDTGMDTRVALIEKEFSIVHGIFEKFERSLEKMTEISTMVQKLLAVHDQRIAERERAESAIFENIERRRAEYERNVERASEKMDEMATDLRKQFKEELSELGENVKKSLADVKTSNEDLGKKIDKSAESTETKMKEMDTRVRDLERWRWAIAGGGAALGFIFAKWQLIASLFGAG